MIIYIGNRFGFLIPLFVVLSEAGVQTIVDAYLGAGYAEKHAWAWGAGSFLAAIVCWLFGQWLRGPKPSNEDQKPGNEPAVGSASFARYAMREIEKEAAFNTPPDSFFFLAMYLWGPLLAVGGIIVILAGALGLVDLNR